MHTRLNIPNVASLFAGLLVSTCFALAGPTVARGQGLDDLFSRPADAVFEDSDEDSGRGPAAFSGRPEATGNVASPSDLRLTNSSGSDARRMPTAMELRQQRALAESRARIARLEASYWGFRPTLRPTWSSDPTTASHYPAVQTYYVPVYVLPR